MVTLDLRLVARLYVDLCRTDVALCPGGSCPVDVDLLWTGSAVRNWFG
jgi:hypothetical protein